MNKGRKRKNRRKKFKIYSFRIYKKEKINKKIEKEKKKPRAPATAGPP